MTKTDAKLLFGNVKKVCEALGIDRRTYYRWPDEFTQARADQLIGAYMRITEEHDRKIIHKFGSAESALL